MSNQLNVTAIACQLLCFCFAQVFSGSAYAQTEKPTPLDNLPAQTVKIKARSDHDFALVADYYVGEKHNGGVLVLHDCNDDRGAYQNVADTLAKQGLHTLLLDFRGYGESVAEGFSREQIKQNALNIVGYQSDMALLTTYWQDDLLAAYQYLGNKIASDKGIAVVASGCSGTYAVALAEKRRLHSMVLISPTMSYNDKERYKNLIDFPSYFITSSHHQESYQTAQELFVWNGDQHSKIQVFKGDSYARQLINRQDYLLEDIARWVKTTLAK